MPDYKSILRRSIEGVPDHTADMRRAIYERARATISRQLTSVNPPLPAEMVMDPVAFKPKRFTPPLFTWTLADCPAMPISVPAVVLTSSSNSP